MVLTALELGADSGAWVAAGFDVSGGTTRIGSVELALALDGGRIGLRSWTLAVAASKGAEADAAELVDLDGLPTRFIPAGGEADAHQGHPNGVLSIDHVVAFSPDLDRTVGRLQEAGLDLRRIREEPTPAGAPRQAFFRVGEAILEVVQMPDRPDLDRRRPARLWGLALRVSDMEATAEYLGDRLGEARPAVQPGRQIATFRGEAGLGLAVALMTPPVADDS